VVVAKAEHSSTRSEARFSGHIEPVSQVEVAFKVAGYVERICMVQGMNGKQRLVQEGDEVVRGQELASVRRADYEQQLAAATAAKLQAEASRKQADLDLGRTRSLVTSGALAQAQLDVDNNRLAGAAAASSEALARVDQAALALRDTSLRSPMNGTIIQRTIEVGTLAAPSTVAFTVADLSAVNVVFAIPDVRLGAVHLGASHSVTVDAMPGMQWVGTITRISPSADPRSHVFEIQLEVSNPERRLKPGMVAALALALDNAVSSTKQAQFFIPLSAVVRAPNGDGFAAYVVIDSPTGSIAHAKNIKLGEYIGRAISVEQGISQDDRIVVQGAGLLSEGERIEVLP
jgi:RND family efflux transporter MFP subunit